MGSDKCVVSCIQYIIQKSFSVSSIPYILPWPNSWPSLTFCTTLIVLPSPYYHIIKLYSVQPFQIVSFSHVLLSTYSFLPYCCLFTNFLSWNTVLCYKCITIFVSICERHLSCFQSLMIINKAAINIHMQVSIWT